MAEFAIRRTSGEGWTYMDCTVEPRSSFLEYGEEKFAGDGSRVETGFVDITWDYGDTPISGAAMRQFLDFCPGASASVQVRTKTREVAADGNQVFRNYNCVMYRPQSQFHRRHGTNQEFIQVVVRFRGSEEVS